MIRRAFGLVRDAALCAACVATIPPLALCALVWVAYDRAEQRAQPRERHR